ncbi:hypothetical protein DCC81_14165 [Chitinophaga parva]|uniref:Uncharacterized protein n=1 Tax=Chitinophaga parva TaxID=2169414 RepID=A0A2T7BGM9_9BACT|nr:hypothetical protein DCC81_14165 [Chitinophaga parva]
MNLDSNNIRRLSVPRRKRSAVVDLVRGPLAGGGRFLIIDFLLAPNMMPFRHTMYIITFKFLI